MANLLRGLAVMEVIDTVAKQPPKVLVTIFLITCLPLYYGSWRYQTGHTRHARPARVTVWSDAFVDAWLGVHVVDPYDPSGLKAYCKRSTWRPNLVFHLADANGGIGNVFGNYLDFLFSAIEAGASIMLPSRATRSDDDLFNVWAGRAKFDTFFDEEWFMSAMKDACPNMTVYPPVSETELVNALPNRYTYPSRRMDVTMENTKSRALEDMDSWLTTQSEYKQDELSTVNLVRTLWAVDTRNLPRGLRRNLGSVLRINPEIRRLAALFVQKMAMVHTLRIDPTEPIPQRAFYGAHLRTEADAAAVGWLNAPNSNFSAQTDAYIQHALKHQLTVMYIASGNASELARFKEKAAANEPPLIVVSKDDLASPAEKEAMEALTWDQRALIDFEILKRCSVFGGFVRSSFSFSIAITRNEWLQDRGWAVDPWFVTHSENGVAFDDGISRIIGRDELHERLIPRGMWP